MDDITTRRRVSLEVKGHGSQVASPKSIRKVSKRRNEGRAGHKRRAAEGTMCPFITRGEGTILWEEGRLTRRRETKGLKSKCMPAMRFLWTAL